MSSFGLSGIDLRQEAAGALWNLSFNDRNPEEIAAAGGVEALDVHETAAGALWNLAFHPGNALRIVEEGGVPALVHLCSSSTSRMARFMAALALAYMFDGRMDEFALTGMSTETTSKAFILDGANRMALEHIEAFVISYYDPHIFAIAASSSAPAALTTITELAQIHGASHLRCWVLYVHPKEDKSFSTSLTFTIPGGQHTVHHVKLLQNVGAPTVLRAIAAATTAPLQVKIFARIVLGNLELQQMELQPN
ncbi:similar to ARABIDILLO-1 [Actinidia rufa]|uniref:Similar to ARABIDILLO-1 n=1 Tax=Actinidia rufa TaxID=165716 RepID=A0A7J0DQC2_9ERIC|nr:similar to ARABIDILLO-1 [Actinidia rufa]